MIAWIGCAPSNRPGMLSRVVRWLKMPAHESSATALKTIDRVRGLEARLERIEADRAMRRMAIDVELNARKDAR
jgi:hypothetical protein